MLIEWIVRRIKDIVFFSFKTSFMVIYTLFFEIWSFIIKYPKIWMGFLLFILSSLLNIKHCKLGFFINYKEQVINHNYPDNCEVNNKYYFNRAALKAIFEEEGKIIQDYVKDGFKINKNYYGDRTKKRK